MLTLSLVSPLHEAGERSFTMHMIEHELIMLVATLLLAASGAGGSARLGLAAAAAAGARRQLEVAAAVAVEAADRAGHGNRRPGRRHVGVARAAAVRPRARQLRLAHRPARLLLPELAPLLVGDAPSARAQRGYGVSAACLFATSLIGGALGALMSLSSSPWYADYAAMGMTGIGLDPIDDQRLAGLIMWIPGGLVHGVAALAMFYKWLKASEAAHSSPAPDLRGYH